MLNISKQKLIVFIALGLAAIIALSIGIAALLSPKKTPVSADYITVTIDNSVGATFTLDKSDYSVVKAETVNKADQFLVDGLSTRLSFPQAMSSFIKKMLDAKKLDGKSDEVLLFAVESRNYEDFEALANQFRNALTENECSSRIHTLYFKIKENSVIAFSEKNNVSYAKAYLCKKIERETDKLKADDLILLSITEIVEQVNKVAKEDLLNKIEQDTIEEQKKEEIKEDVSQAVSGDTSGDVSSDSSSNDTSSDGSSSDSSSSDGSSSDTSSDSSSNDTSSDGSSSDSSSSDSTSSDTTSSDNTFSVEDDDDEEKWTEIT